MKGSVSMFFIETERLNLTPFRREDSKDYFEIIRDEAIKKYVPYASAYTIESTESHIALYEKGDFINDFYIAIRLKKSKKIIGAIIAVRMSHCNLDISYLVHKDYRNQGYMTEAMKAFIQYLKFSDISGNMIFTIEDGNSISRSVAISCGAKFTELLYKSHVYLLKF